MSREHILNSVRKQLSLAVEGAEVTVAEVDPITEDESVSANAIETIGDMAEADVANDEAQELEVLEESGEELIAAVEGAIARQTGLRKFEAIALKKTVAQLTRKYSGVVVDLMPATEAYGGTDDALSTTVLAHETLKDSFHTFWEAAKKQFLKVIETFQMIFRKIIALFTSVTKRAQALKARAEHANDNAGKMVEVNVSGLRTGSVEVNQATVTGLKNILDVTSALLKSSRQIDDRAEVNKGVEAIKDSNSWEDYVNGVNSYARRTFDSIDSSKEGVSALLPGNRAITFNEGQANSRDQFSFEALVTFGEVKVETGSVPALSRKEIIEVADTVIAIAEQISQYDKIWSRNTTKAARLVQGISAAVKGDISKLENEEAATPEEEVEKESRITRFKINVASLIGHVRRLDKFSSDLVAYAQEVSIEALAYGEKSVVENAVAAA